jgi:DNA-binding NtrC family response regulator
MFSSTEAVFFHESARYLSAEKTEKWQTMENASRHAQTKTILIVDDEPIVQQICATVLRKQGFDPVIAVNGTEGLEAYRERYQEICLVLSDISMPLMDGIEMTRKMFEVYSHANVILMSGANLSDLIPDEVKKLCSVIEKPFSPARLMEAVEKCLKYDKERSSAEASR